MGLRPTEVRGLRWSDVDFEAGTIAAGDNTRTLVDGEIEEMEAKSAAGKGGLPMPATVTKALKAFHTLQKKERLKAGNAYVDSGYVLVNELGQPQRTDWLRRRVYELMTKVEVRKVRPYDSRHACLAYLAGAGVPDVVLAAWAGHADGGTLAKRGVRPPRQQPPESGGRAPRIRAVRVTPTSENSAVRAYVRNCETEQQEGLDSRK
ncbi:tyrosine-type recombinase/integrase [Micromonospora sp. U21]|nr:tyrosine-type recombinase/integrase [Micromonospora sp. U21]